MIFGKKWFFPALISAIFFIINALWGWWWMNGVMSFAISFLFFKSKRTSFIVFFSFVFVFWIAQSIWKDAQAEYAVSNFLSSLFGEMSPFLTYMLTGLMGGLISGWAGFLGCSLRNISK
jgi:hypothetical protein